MPRGETGIRKTVALIAGLFLLQVASVVYFANQPVRFISPEHYLHLHTLLEIFSILVSFGIFIVGMATHRNVRSTSILFLSVSSLSVGLFDLAHTLSFPGMPDLFSPNSSDKMIHFWLAARGLDAIALLLVPLFATARFQFRRMGLVSVLAVTAASVFAFSVITNGEQYLPAMFHEGIGLTPTKVTAECLIIAALLFAAVLYFRNSDKQNLISYRWLGTACMVFAMTEIYFTQYIALNDSMHLFGHIYKLMGFALLFRAVFVECVAIPYREMQRMASEAQAASEAKTQLLANISHEFRTPLTIIAGYSDRALNKKNLDPEIATWMGSILRNTWQLNQLIGDLLDLAKLENGRVSVVSVPFNVDEAVMELVSSLKVVTDNKGLEVIIDRDASAPSEIWSDPLRFRQILTNILSNAIRFTERGGITIHLSGHGEPSNPKGITVVISDTGVGIDPGHVARLFEPYYQCDNSGNQRLDGTGLGLALSRELARLLGGDVWLKSSTPGKGSTFSIAFPSQRSVADFDAMSSRLVRIDGPQVSMSCHATS